MGRLINRKILGGAPWLPSNDGSAISWWDATDTGTITKTGDEVDQWDDKVGTENLLLHSSKGPDSGTRTQNSKNVLDFNSTTGESLVKTSFPVGSGDLMFAIAYVAEGFSSATAGLFAVDGTTDDWQFDWTDTGNDGQFWSTMASDIDVTTDCQDSAWHVLVVWIDEANTIDIYLDGTQICTPATPSARTDTTATLRLMANRTGFQFTDGAVMHFAITSDITQSTREKYEGYFAHQANTQSLLPGGHPYKSSPPTV